MPPLTPVQERVLSALLTFMREHGRPPSFSELSLAAGYPNANPGNVQKTIRILREKGRVDPPSVESRERSPAGLWPTGLREKFRRLVEEYANPKGQTHE